MFRTPSEYRKSSPVKLPLMTVPCSACNNSPSDDIPVRVIYPPNTSFPAKTKKEIEAAEKRLKEKKRTPSLSQIGDFFLVEPWEEITVNSLAKYRALFKVTPRVECAVCIAKRILIELAAGKSRINIFHVDTGQRITDALWGWSAIVQEVGSVSTKEVLRGKLAHNEIREWARSLVRIVAVDQREAWIYDCYRRQRSSEDVLYWARSVATSEEQEQIHKLISAVHEESLLLLRTQGIATLQRRPPVKRSRGRPSRPALKVLLKLLVNLKLRELEARNKSTSKVHALLKVLPIVVRDCYDLREDFFRNPAALAMRLRNYL
jgi:hypothetical protein